MAEAVVEGRADGNIVESLLMSFFVEVEALLPIHEAALGGTWRRAPPLRLLVRERSIEQCSERERGGNWAELRVPGGITRSNDLAVRLEGQVSHRINLAEARGNQSARAEGWGVAQG